MLRAFSIPKAPEGWTVARYRGNKLRRSRGYQIERWPAFQRASWIEPRLSVSVATGVTRCLTLLWQIYSRRFSLPIHFRQCGHRFCGSRAMRVTMAWRTDGKLG